MKETYSTGTLKNKFKIRDYDELHLIIRNILDNKNLKLLQIDGFELSITYFKYIHYELFNSIYFFAGTFRNVSITKTEPFLLGYQLQFTDYNEIERELARFPILNENNKIREIVENLAFLWKTHPFRAGNTITCIIFTCKYVEKIFGYNIYDDIKQDYIRFYVALILSLLENNQTELYIFFEQIIKKYDRQTYIVKD